MSFGASLWIATLSSIARKDAGMHLLACRFDCPLAESAVGADGKAAMPY